MGNQISVVSFELESGFSTIFKGGVPSRALVTGLALSVLVVISRDETLDLTFGDIVGVM